MRRAPRRRPARSRRTRRDVTAGESRLRHGLRGSGERGGARRARASDPKLGARRVGERARAHIARSTHAHMHARPRCAHAMNFCLRICTHARTLLITNATFGVVDQLVDRSLRMREVRGSKPRYSTVFLSYPLFFFHTPLREPGWRNRIFFMPPYTCLLYTSPSPRDS